jgi:carboxyl-terminal processing protease
MSHRTATVARLTRALLACAFPGLLWAQDYAGDFNRFWGQARADYPYFAAKQTDWECVQRVYGPQAAAADDDRGFIRVLERALDELYDPHASLNVNLASSTRLIPTGLDLWAEWRDGAAIITQLRPGSRAERAGLRAGMELLAINGLPTADAVEARLGHCLREHDAEVRGWGLLAVLAGSRDVSRVLVVREDPGSREFRPDELPELAVDVPAVTARELDDGVGYIALHHLGDSDSVAQFDAALLQFRRGRGLVLDLRDTAAGGDTEVAEPIMGRLVDRTLPYQRVQPVHGKPWLARVHPRGPFTYRAPLVVLVSRWTGSMGEGMAIGLDGMHRATVVGTRMAGLNGGVFRHHLPAANLDYTLPGEALLHLDGRPRERYVPSVNVDLVTAAAAATEGDPILAAGLEQLRKLMAQGQHGQRPAQQPGSSATGAGD